MTRFSLDSDLDYKLKTVYRGSQHTEPIHRVCRVPWNAITVDTQSRIFLCDCDGWLPIPVGKVQDFSSIQDILQSDVAKVLHQDIEEKKYTWCAVKHCNIINWDLIPKRMHITISIDESCNLYCPSCRRDRIMIESGPEFERKKRDVYNVMSWLDSWTSPTLITLTGNGDALASHITRPLVLEYQAKENIQFELKTNGLLLEKIMSRSSIKNNVWNYSISVDAATEETYEDVRRPGRWKDLLRNLDWLKNNRGSTLVLMNFVVQRKNYKEIPRFIEWCRELGFLPCFIPLNDWGTWNPEAVETPDTWTIHNGSYPDHDVIDPSHPEHHAFRTVIESLSPADKQLLPKIMTFL